MKFSDIRNVMWGGTHGWAVAVITFFTIGFVSAVHAQTGTETSATAATHVPIVFSGGHQTEGRDRGRPVILVAGALGVPPEVFREAFTHVHPAGVDSGGPTREEAQANKAALMNALEKYGVDNDRLDEVSNYYRYVRSHGEHWPSKPAEAYAVVVKGIITSYVVTSGGSGYSSDPTVSIAGFEGVAAPKITLSFNKTFSKNGTISAITLPDGTGK